MEISVDISQGKGGGVKLSAKFELAIRRSAFTHERTYCANWLKHYIFLVQKEVSNYLDVLFILDEMVELK